MSENLNLVDKAVTIMILADATMSNPNGDPDADNIPRTNYAGNGYMTGYCQKSKIRNVLANHVAFGELPADEYRLYDSRKNRSIQAAVNEVIAEYDVPTDNKKKKLDRDELDKRVAAARNALCRTFADVRWFGLVNTAYANTPNFSCIKGAVQVGDAMTYDPVHITELSITRGIVAKNEDEFDTKDKTMGRHSVIEYGLFHTLIQVSPAMAMENGVTWDDVNVLIDAILHMYEEDMSSARPSMNIRKVIAVYHSSRSGNCSRQTIEDAMVVKKKDGVTTPMFYGDYDVHFDRDKLPKCVTVKEYSIEVPEGKEIE